MIEKIKKIISDKPVLFILVVNILPIIGVLFFHWDYLMIIMLYIVETFIVGVVNVAKMIKSEGKIDNNKIQFNGTNKQIEKPGCLKLFLVPFFIFHYNFFIAIQVIFVLIFASGLGGETVNLQRFLSFDFIFNILFIAGSHIYTYQKNYIKNNKYQKMTPDILMISPYKRIFIQQITVIFGGILLMVFKAPVFLLVILIILKIIVDIMAHNKTDESLEKFYEKIKKMKNNI